MRLLSSVIGKISLAGGIVAGVGIVLMMLAESYEVVMRYVFHHGTYWAVEVVGYLLLMVTMLAAGYIQRQGAHIKIDLITTRLPERVQTQLCIIISILALFFCIILVWESWEMALQSYQHGFTCSTRLGMPFFIPQLLIPIGIGIFSLEFMVSIGRDIASLRRRSHPEDNKSEVT